jgi:protein-disulfide isomerase
VKADFRGAVRAGVVTTPTVFIAGTPFAGRATMDAVSRIEPGSGPVRNH